MDPRSVWSLLTVVALCAADLPSAAFAADAATPAVSQPSKPQKTKKAKPVRRGAKKRSPRKAEVYVCPMGDYEGALTKDGRCPKCGMQLQKKQ